MVKLIDVFFQALYDEANRLTDLEISKRDNHSDYGQREMTLEFNVYKLVNKIIKDAGEKVESGQEG